MNFFVSTTNAITGAAGVDFLNFTRNADNSFSIEVFDSAPTG